MGIQSYFILFTVLKYFFFFFSICVFINVQTIYSVFGLVLAFIFGACLSILAGATFIGFILVVVYVGAVLVFFLFVTMMLNLRTEIIVSRSDIFFYIGFLSAIFLILDIFSFSNNEIIEGYNFLYFLGYQSNIIVIGYLLYSFYFVPLLVCALILFIAMLGAIVLLLYYPTSKTQLGAYTRAQDISFQVGRQEFEVVKLNKFKIYQF